jgi:acylphosphatase/outer membrane murein-binding lipoprotein Lpp
MVLMKRVILHISGNVQQAGYRAKVIAIANVLDIKGNVRNLTDGRVKIVAEGEEADLERFIKGVNIKNTLINVSDIAKEHSYPTGDYERFYKLVSEGETDERLDTAADLLKELIHVSKSGFDNLGGKIDQLGDDLGGKIDQLGDDLGGKIDNLGGKIDDLGGKIDNLGGKIDNLGGKIDDLGGKIDQLEDGLGGKIDQLGDDLGGKIDQLGDDLGGKIDQLGDDLGGKIDQLGDDLGGKTDQSRIEITSEIRTSKEDLSSNFDARISVIEHDLAQIKAKVMM